MDNLSKVFKRYYKKYFHVRLVCYIFIFLIAAMLPVIEEWLGIGSIPVIGPLYVAIEDKVSFAVVVAIVYDEIRRYIARSHEEDSKTESDHHLIIRKYTDKKYGHDVGFPKSAGNYFAKEGCIMQLSHLDHDYDNKLKPVNREKHAKDRNLEIQSIKNFLERNPERKKPPFLNLPSLNVFTNIEGDFKMTVTDSNQIKPLPGLVEKNIGEILAAHRYSKATNNLTIRLNDFTFNPETKELHLDTMRSTYFYMLLTNRAMDYPFQEMTLRSFYEYKPKITPLAEQGLGNQIGINGVLITTDGYLLVEKRRKNKATWKDKFGQPISLAFKAKDAFDPKDGDTFTDQTIQTAMIKCIEKTLSSNFGLRKEDYRPIMLSKNLMGIARDLLEGGKPNIYFYVELKTNAEDTANLLQKYASLDVEKIENGEAVEKPLEKEKLDPDYYLVKYEDFKISYYYCLKIKKSKNQKEGPLKIRRKLKPRSTPEKKVTVQHMVDHPVTKHVLYSKIQINREKQHFIVKKKCGEGLLVCLSYLELLQSRIDNLKK